MKKWAGNLLLFLGATIVSLGALELVLRLVYPAHETWRLFSVPDPELGWVLEPGAEFTRQVPGAFVKVHYNAQGFRDSAFPGTPPQDATRIVVLGDSFMEANMVPLEEVFHKQLERLAAADGRKIRTWNLGVAGYGTLQEYMTFLKAGAQQKPDLVLLAFYMHNDVRNNAEHLNVPAQARRKGYRKRPFLDESDEAHWRILKPDFDEVNARFLKKINSLSFRVRHNSVLLSMIRNAGRAWESNEEAFGGALSMHACSEKPPYDKAWRTTERIFRRLNDAVSKTGARLIVFPVPAAFDADMDILADFENGGKPGGRLCVENSPGYARLRAILERAGIPYIDLVPDFRRAVSGEGQDLFVRGDWHWNGKGHALAARQVYDALTARGFLPD